jgi:hypothetical protein
MTETVSILRAWFLQATRINGSLDTMEIDYETVADFLVFKKLFNERTTSVKFILKALKIKLEGIN